MSCGSLGNVEGLQEGEVRAAWALAGPESWSRHSHSPSGKKSKK